MLDLNETSLLDQGDLIPYRDRAPHSLRPGFEAMSNLGRQSLVHHDIRKL
jgi:hypothetical protein